MAYFYFDDSKHHTWGVSIGAFVIFDHDPQADILRMIIALGFDPDTFEFKSSKIMKGNAGAQKLRVAFRDYVRSKGKIALCITNLDKRIGPAGLDLLANATSHPLLQSDDHVVFFDEGLFSSSGAARNLARNKGVPLRCTLHFEQKSQKIAGIQLADLIAHMCATLLLDAIGKPKKFVDWPDSGYDNDIEIDLAFELWAYLRGSFLSIQSPSSSVDFDPTVVDIEAYGLHIDPNVDAGIASAARRRFGTMYIGCAH